MALRPAKGLYCKYSPANSALLYDAKIIGGPTVIMGATRLWTCVTEAGDTFVLPEPRLSYISRNSHNGAFGVTPLYAECPECGEEDQFFLEEDYVCGYCRTNVLDR